MTIDQKINRRMMDVVKRYYQVLLWSTELHQKEMGKFPSNLTNGGHRNTCYDFRYQNSNLRKLEKGIFWV